MSRYDNIVLIGFMGCGKSTVAVALAKLYNWQVVDLDDLIVRTAGKSIPDIFADEGEESFRRLETDALHSLTGRRGLVVAAGGGIVLKKENWSLMRQLGPVVFLQTDPEVLRTRLEHPSGRPLADGLHWTDLLARYHQRLPLYRKADVIIELADESPADAAGLVLAKIESFAGQTQWLS